MKESVLKSIEDLRKGKMIIIVDDVDRENEGDVVIAADKVTESAMTFMAKKASGLVCLSITKAIAKKLELTPMCENNQESMKTAFTISVDSKRGITTGISAADRVKTILDVVNGSADDIVRPGHMFPVVAKDGGVLERRGHTEASVELVKMAGLSPAAVICEILGDDGKLLRGEDLRNFAKENALQLVHIEEIVEHLKNKIVFSDNIKLQTDFGIFNCLVVKEDNKEHFVLYKGKIKDQNCLVRIHSECLTGDLFGSKRCDCGEQLKLAMERISKEGGVLIYLRQEGRGIGLFNKIRAYQLQDQGLDTVDANIELGLPIDGRKYEIAAKILNKFSPSNIKLMTNNPKKLEVLKDLLSISIDRVPILGEGTELNINYLITKQQKMNHLMECDICHIK